MMRETDFKARGAPKGSGGSNRPPKPPRGAGGPPSGPSGEIGGVPRLVTQRFFYETMMGLSRGWYNHHLDDPGFPRRRIGPGGKPMLLLSDCLAYQARFLAQAH